MDNMKHRTELTKYVQNVQQLFAFILLGCVTLTAAYFGCEYFDCIINDSLILIDRNMNELRNEALNKCFILIEIIRI